MNNCIEIMFLSKKYNHKEALSTVENVILSSFNI